MPEAAPAARRFLSGIRELSGRTPLRIKLITAVLALVAIALAVISIAGLSVIRTYQLGQADSQLQTLASEAPRAVGQYVAGESPGVAPEATVAWIPSGGQLHVVVEPTAAGFGARFAPGAPDILPGPALPTDSNWLTAHHGNPITVPAQSGGGRWRVFIENASYQTATGGTISGAIVVGVDVTTAYATIGKLAVIDLVLSVAIILGLAIVGRAVVRASLRPLTEMEKTAEGIAAGDLTRRVPDRDPRTEVGRLGRSLNTMLAQIESAFGARAASEYAARRSEDKMRQFVADASHELRTPLTAIRGFAEYYRQRGGLGERADQANGTSGASGASGGNGAAGAQRGSLDRADLDRIMWRVEQESSRMGVLVEDMLLLARLDQQRPLEQRPVDLLTLAADAVHDARVVAPDRSIELTVDAGAAPIVLGDETRLRQVIGNLMSNALTHTPEGTPVAVRIRPGTLDQPRPPGTAPASAPAVVLEVADRGSGLTPDQAERIFERFYRADQARTRKAGGTGLGLAIVAALVTAHGGTVWVESPNGGGATFLIALPLAPEARHSGPEPDEGTEPDIIDSGTPGADSRPGSTAG